MKRLIYVLQEIFFFKKFFKKKHLFKGKVYILVITLKINGNENYWLQCLVV